MIFKRTIEKAILKVSEYYPITLITGARQVGKTVLATEIEDKWNYNYISLDKGKNEDFAKNEPEKFLESNKSPLIVDEIQKAPVLFKEMVGIVNEIRRKNGGDAATNMYILTGSQKYELMKNVTESMAGRVGIIEMPPLSQAEINGWEEKPFKVDLIDLMKKSEDRTLDEESLYKSILRGFYPRLWENKNYPVQEFYKDYVKTYLDKDVSKLVNIKDIKKFEDFLTYLASLTGQEFIPSNVSNALGIDRRKVDSWTSILISGDIIRLLPPYYEKSIKKRIVRRSKLFFNDTGLACYLLGLNSTYLLLSSSYKGPLFETYVHNEIRKSFINNGIDTSRQMFYYRDTNQNEIDLIILTDEGLNLIECKAGKNISKNALSSFNQIIDTDYKIVGKCVICTEQQPKKIVSDVFALPFRCI